MVLTVGVLRDGHVDVVKTYEWTGVPHHTTIPEVEALARHWRLRNLVVDATGQGEAVASVLSKSLGERIVTPFVFSQAKKSELAYELLAKVQRNELRIHTGAPEELWSQIALARTKVRPSRVMDFFVDPREGHDDYLMSLALVAKAAATVRPERVARGWPSAEARNSELRIARGRRGPGGLWEPHPQAVTPPGPLPGGGWWV